MFRRPNPGRLAPLGATLGTLVLFVTLVSPDTAAAGRKYHVLRWMEDWSWVGNGAPPTPDPFDGVKNVSLGGDWYLSFGGSTRLRLESDSNRYLKGGDDSLLEQFRLFTHLEIGKPDLFRWFAEARFSDTWDSDRHPVNALFHDDPDFQNFFLELTAAGRSSHPVTFRVGRQELLFGAQRLFSPLDWSSTRRTFDGITITFDTPRTKTIVFGTAPVMHEPNDIDSPMEHEIHVGVHANIEFEGGHHLEGYFYNQHDNRDVFASEIADVDPADLDRRTFGVRYVLNKGGWSLDTEWALQNGEHGPDDISAWMGSVTVGYGWKDAAWSPAVELGLDVASGDADPMDGDFETFNHLYPLGHAYMGHIDLVGRQNVDAARLQLVLKPMKGLKWVNTLHFFQLDEERDALYNAGGGAILSDPTGLSGDDVATELDVLLAYGWGTHHSVAFEITKWWSGDFVEATAVDGDDAWFAWAAYEFKF